MVEDNRPVVAKSAGKHGINEPDVLHAYANAIRVIPIDEGMAMLVGPDRAGRLLEIGLVAHPFPMIVHAMSARPKFLKGL